MLRSAVVLGVLGLLPAAPAQPAARASVSADGWRLTYRAAAGQVNEVVASVSGDAAPDTLLYMIDDSVPITAGRGCDHPIAKDRTSVRCRVTPSGSEDPYASLSMILSDRDDSVEFHNTTGQTHYFSEFWLGDGQDMLNSSDATNGDGSSVRGQDGDDRVVTGAAATVQGGNGDDTLTTTGDYGVLEGGRGDDILLAGVGAQLLRGGAGDDLIRGGAGQDTLHGGAGDDRLFGEQGADTLYGNAGDDRLTGGSGPDVLRGGPGKDTLRP